jgi:hypothetical protein
MVMPRNSLRTGKRHNMRVIGRIFPHLVLIQNTVIENRHLITPLLVFQGSSRNFNMKYGNLKIIPVLHKLSQPPESDTIKGLNVNNERIAEALFRIR